jgi:hypothetical protein
VKISKDICPDLSPYNALNKGAPKNKYVIIGIKIEIRGETQ